MHLVNSKNTFIRRDRGLNEPHKEKSQSTRASVSCIGQGAEGTRNRVKMHAITHLTQCTHIPLQYTQTNPPPPPINQSFLWPKMEAKEAGELTCHVDFGRALNPSPEDALLWCLPSSLAASFPAVCSFSGVFGDSLEALGSLEAARDASAAPAEDGEAEVVA